ncbi:MAG: prolyl aminopeptidase [Rhodospirillales bacterium]|nr:prolyl aminopeptidase [Rhodospirillales bacterium]MCB9973552.1 prolyl aminopeptidase [Rhodospirillales bacterium]
MHKRLYPKPTDVTSGFLDVGNGHRLYYEVSGPPDGFPVLYLHGGPGAGCSGQEHRYFDPSFYRVILMDQRGAGKSTPYAETAHNSPEFLLQDIETLRKHLHIQKWAIAGGSWGTCLALLYAVKHPQHVLRLLLRGLFFGDPAGARHLAEEGGASAIQPKYFEQYAHAPFIPPEARHNLIMAYHDILTFGDAPTRLEAAKRFDLWDTSIAFAHLNEPVLKTIENNPEGSLALATLFFHYARHYYTDSHLKGKIFAGKHALDDMLIDVIHGECDWICPVENAYEFKKYVPHANLTVILAGGHSMGDPLIRDAFVTTLNRWQDEDV